MAENNKKKLKNFLYISTIILFTILVLLLGYGIFFEVPITTNLEKKNGQLHIVDITKPIENDYASFEEQEDLDKGVKELTEENINYENEKSITENLEESNNNQQSKNEEKYRFRSKPKISLIVTNLGTNKDLTERALELPSNINLGFSAYTTSLKPLFHEALKKSFELYVYLPFEPRDYPLSDPGPYAILSSNSYEKNIKIIQGILSEFKGIKGVYGNYREVFTKNKLSFMPLLTDFKKNNLKIVLGRNIDEDSPNYLQSFENVISADIIVDLVPDEETIRHNLSNLVSIAKSKGYALGYFNTYPVSLKALKSWLNTIDKDKVDIVPISELIAK